MIVSSSTGEESQAKENPLWLGPGHDPGADLLSRFQIGVWHPGLT
jgi:hypothetical protein